MRSVAQPTIDFNFSAVAEHEDRDGFYTGILEVCVWWKEPEECEDTAWEFLRDELLDALRADYPYHRDITFDLPPSTKWKRVEASVEGYEEAVFKLDVEAFSRDE